MADDGAILCRSSTRSSRATSGRRRWQTCGLPCSAAWVRFTTLGWSRGLGGEAQDTAGLRRALADLQAELKELRRDQQTIGAGTVGELREHNRRERKREVVPQRIEVVTL